MMENRGYLSPNASPTPYVTLNVGGARYCTTTQTLLSNPNTLFSNTLSTLPRDRDGNIFIDRDSVYFRYILDSLRLGEVQYPFKEDSYDAIRYWKEIDYFRLFAPGHIWSFSKKKDLKHPALNISEDGFSVTKVVKSKPASATVCGNKALSTGKYRWRVITFGAPGKIIFGIIHQTAYKTLKLESDKVHALSTSNRAYGLSVYGDVDDEDDEEEEIPEKKETPKVLMKPEDTLGNRVILNESDDSDKDKDSSSSSDEKDSGYRSDEALASKKVVNIVDPLEGVAKRDFKRVEREEHFLMEYEAMTGVVKVYSQDQERWYTGQVPEKKEGYHFFALLKEVDNKIRVELLE